MFYIRRFSLSIDLDPKSYEIPSLFAAQLSVTYGSLRRTSAVRQSEQVHLDEPVRTDIIQGFTYKEG